MRNNPPTLPITRRITPENGQNDTVGHDPNNPPEERNNPPEERNNPPEEPNNPTPPAQVMRRNRTPDSSPTLTPDLPPRMMQQERSPSPEVIELLDSPRSATPRTPRLRPQSQGPEEYGPLDLGDPEIPIDATDNPELPPQQHLAPQYMTTYDDVGRSILLRVGDMQQDTTASILSTMINMAEQQNRAPSATPTTVPSSSTSYLTPISSPRQTPSATPTATPRSSNSEVSEVGTSERQAWQDGVDALSAPSTSAGSSPRQALSEAPTTVPSSPTSYRTPISSPRGR